MEQTIPDEVYDQMLHITDKIFKLPFAEAFRKPVGPEVEGYHAIIEEPMDLGQIIERLEQKSFKTVKDWKAEMTRVFRNSMKFNPEGSELYVFAEYLLGYFNGKSECIPNSNSETEKCLILKVSRKLSSLLDSRPQMTKSKKK